MFLRQLGSRVTLVWRIWMELVNLGTSRGAMICSMVPCSSLVACDLVSAVNFLYKLTHVFSSQFAGPPSLYSGRGEAEGVEKQTLILAVQTAICCVQMVNF